MKKNKIVIITLVLGILFLTSYLYSSYATSTGVSLGNNENTYDILLNDSTDTVNVPAKSSKTIYYQFSNTNKGTIKYHIGYSSNNVIAKVWWDTEDKVSDTIEYGEYKFIKLKLINDTTEDDTITIKPVLGFVNGGDVIPDSNTTLVTGTINKTNTWNKVLPVDKTTIKEIYFVNDNIVPEDALGSANGNTDGSIKTWYTSSDTDGQYKVYIGSDNGISTFSGDYNKVFNGYTNLTYADFTYVDTLRVTSMQNMFLNDSKLVTLKIENFDTSNVESMYQMFYGCSSLTNLNVSYFNTSSVKSMQSMFSGCSNLTKLDVSNFDTSSVTTMYAMFSGCIRVKYLDVSNFDTSSVRSMYQMFNRCSSLTSLDLHNFDTSNVGSMYQMFNNCLNLISLDLSNFNTSSVENMAYLFHECNNLTSVNLSGWNTRKVTTMQRMFYGCSKLLTIDLSSFETPKLNNTNNMFYGRNVKKNTIDLRNADLSGVTDYTSMWGSGSTNIYLNDTQDNRDFMNTHFPSVTGVQYIPSS